MKKHFLLLFFFSFAVCPTANSMVKTHVSVLHKSLFFSLNFFLIFFLIKQYKNIVLSPEKWEQEERYNAHKNQYLEEINALLTQEKKILLKKIRKIDWDHVQELKIDKAYKRPIKDEITLKESKDIEEGIKQQFQENDLVFLYFFMIHKNDIEGYKVVEKIYEFLPISSHKIMWENLIKMFLKCGPCYQKLFLCFFNKNEYELGKILGSRRIRYPFFLTYDIFRLIKDKIKKTINCNNIIKLEHLKEFLINYILVDKHMSFVWNCRYFSPTYTPLVDVPLYRIGQVAPENSLEMCQQFLALIDWFNNFVQEHGDRKLSWKFFPMLELLIGRNCSNKKLSDMAINKEKLCEGAMLWLLLRHIDEQKRPENEENFRYDTFDFSEQKLSNFEFLLDKVSTKTYNKFFIEMIVWRWHLDTEKAYFELLYHVAQKVKFDKGDNWKIEEHKNVITKQKEIIIKSDYCTIESKQRIIGVNNNKYLNAAEEMYINQKWKIFLEVVAANGCAIPEMLPSAIYK